MILLVPCPKPIPPRGERPAFSPTWSETSEIPPSSSGRPGFWRRSLKLLARSLTVGNGMPPSGSYRSARRNQRASPPVLWQAPGIARRSAIAGRTPNEPFLPIFLHPRRSMSIRTTTPTACRNRLVRRGSLEERKPSMAGWDSSSRTTPAKAGLS